MEERPEILLSATQVSLFTECPRKWGFKYLERIPDPPKPGALLGTEVQDTQLDPYLATGRGFDFSRPSGEIANALVPLLPKPGAPGMRLRRKFRMPSPTGLFGWQGEFDVWGEDSSIVPGLAGGRPLLGDIKTTKDLKYAKTRSDLLTDMQCQLYAANIMFAEEGADELDAVWWYVRTQRPHKVQRTHALLKAPDVAEQFAKIDAVGSEVRTIKLARPKVDDLRPNPRMCDQYGGCPYRKICNLSPASFASAWNEGASESMGSTNDFLAGLRKQVGDTGNTQQAGATVVETKFGLAVQEPAHVPDAATLINMQAAGLAAAVAKGPPKINPPETELPPAPATGGVAEAPKPVEAKKRGRPRKDAQPSEPAAVSSEVACFDGLESLGFPRSEFATFLRAWASRMEAP